MTQLVTKKCVKVTGSMPSLTCRVEETCLVMWTLPTEFIGKVLSGA